MISERRGNQFKLVTDLKPAGDQPQAIKELVENSRRGIRNQVLLGVTGSGKTFTMANLIAKTNRPTLVISHNKTLAAQLYAEFRQFFPENAVEYFISYYDYYQPEAYIPSSDTYIEKDSAINDQIDRLRLKATMSLLTRRDVIVVASVSCIYNLGNPAEFKEMCVLVEKGRTKPRDVLASELVAISYERNDIGFARGKFRARGDVVEIFPAYQDNRAVRVELSGDEISRISEIDPLTGRRLAELDKAYVYPARHFVMTRPKIEAAVGEIKKELAVRLRELEQGGKLLEAQRLKMRTNYDIEMMLETGLCHGIENYSRILSARPPGSRPACLIDYFPEDFLVIIDESHVSVPQIRGMYEGDRARKQTLVDFGFRLPSALDNRPLKFNEFEALVPGCIFTTATPAPYELEKSKGVIVEQVIRPTGLVDPDVVVRPTEGQVDDLMREVSARTAKKERVLVTTLTKRMAEDLCEYLSEKKLRVQYLHSDIAALDRVEILQNLRRGEFDCLIGVNLLREGLDLPEVTLVAILDADKEGFLRSETTLIQTCGRAARNVNGKVILYADNITGSMERALSEMNRRRKKQIEYNTVHKIIPRTIQKAVRQMDELTYAARREGLDAQLASMFFVADAAEAALVPPGKRSGRKSGKPSTLSNMHPSAPRVPLSQLISELKRRMSEAADALDFELAAALRDKLFEIQEMMPKKGAWKPRPSPSQNV